MNAHEDTMQVTNGNAKFIIASSDHIAWVAGYTCMFLTVQQDSITPQGQAWSAQMHRAL